MNNEETNQTQVTDYNVSKFCGDFLKFEEGKFVSVDKAFLNYTYSYVADETKENLNAFIVESLKNGKNVVNLDGILFFYNLNWK